MKKKNMSLVLAVLLLVLAVAVNLTGCTTNVGATDLMEGITPNKLDLRVELNAQSVSVSDFAVRLFKACENSGENTLISPLSVLYALGMTANGAEGETLTEMEAVLGIRLKELNHYFYTYLSDSAESEKYNYKLSLANSIWFTDDESFKVNQSFLQTNADYYGAGIYKAPFNDQTCNDINNWIEEKTDGMVTKVLKELNPEDVMCLINALAFEGEWSEVYKEAAVNTGEFTKEDGTKQTAEFMSSTERMYLEDEKAVGFIKEYKGGKYAFAVMLPKEGVSVSEYVASLDGKALNTLLSNPKHLTVYSSMPKFEIGYDTELNEVLKSMGMEKAFEASTAEFGGIGTSDNGNIFIGSVLHKTFISVGEQGTKAGASTVVVMETAGIALPNVPKEVKLDRPFVYMIIDSQNNIPLFIGTAADIGK